MTRSPCNALALARALAIALGVALAPAPAMAAATLVHTAADFTNEAPFGAIIQYRDTDNLPGNDFIRYGFGSSSSNFQVNRLLFETPRFRAIAFDTPVSIGSLNLLNLPAFSVLEQVDLNLAMQLDIDGAPIALAPLAARLAIVDTPNTGPVANCQFPSASSCADAIRLTGGLLSDQQAIAGGTLSYTVLGFSDGAGGLRDHFWADEFSGGTGELMARFAFTPSVAGVPEPSAWALLIVGFGAIGARMRRSRRRSHRSGRGETPSKSPIGARALIAAPALAATIFGWSAPAAAQVGARANQIPQNPYHTIYSTNNVSTPTFAQAHINSSIGFAEASGSISPGHVAAQTRVSLSTGNPYEAGVFDARVQATQIDTFRASDTLCEALNCTPAIQLGIAQFELDFTIRASGTVFAAALDDRFDRAESSIGHSWQLASSSNVVSGGGYKYTDSIGSVQGDIQSQHNSVFMRPGDSLSLLLSAVTYSKANISGFANSGYDSAFSSTGADFSHTLEWGGITGFRAYDAGGNLVQLAQGSRLTLLDGAGNDFWFSAASFGTGAIPEPSSWALLILGFGAVGAGMRRRTSAVAFA